jgi:ribonuclease HII
MLLAGVDEAGRGPLAGPVFAAAVILAEKPRMRGLKDSKLLTAGRREVLALRIQERAIAWAVASASVEEIDRINILQATLLAMRRAVEALGTVPTEIVVDGLHCPAVSCPSRAIVDGDLNVPVISAASILAKTARDALLIELDRQYPGYGFAQHKGYGTPQHLAALQKLGPCPLHRKSFAPVAQLGFEFE